MNQRLGVLLRLLLDAALLAGALLAAFMLRFVYAVSYEIPERDVTTAESLERYVQNFSLCALLILPLSLASFAFFGLYSPRRPEKIRDRALAVAKAVSLPYVAAPLAMYLLRETFPLPRSVLFIAWGMTLALVMLARTWSVLWRRLLIHEEGPQLQRARDEHKVLLIGGAGYIGSALLPRLLAAGYHVRLLDMFLYGKEPIREHLAHPNLEIIEGDFRRVERVVSAVQGVGAVVHLGGIVGDPACALDEQLTLEVNLVATRLVAEVAKGEGVRRFVFASSCSVYGASNAMLDEHSPLNPVSLYARSKIASERVLLDARDRNFAPIILRFGTIFGVSGRMRFDLVVNLLAAKAVLDGKITVFGGDQWRPFVHVDDAARSVVSALGAPIENVAGEIFNIGGDKLNYTLTQVGEAILKRVPNAQLLDSGANADRRNYRVSFAKARRLLRFEPQRTLDEGIEQVLAAIRAGEVSDYSLAKYSNVKFLTDEKFKLLEKEGGWEKRLIDGTGPVENVVT